MIKNIQSRFDGWLNLISGIGKKGRDKTESNEFGSYEIFDDQTLSYLYDGEGLCATIIDTIPDDMTRPGWIIENDDDGKIEEEQKRLKLSQTFNEALKYARLYRGSIIVIVTDRGTLDTPLPSKINKIIGLKVFSAARIELLSSDFITDSNNSFFEDIEIFHVRLRDGSLINIHRSRCVVFYGEMTSDYGDLDLKYKYWGFSVIQRIWDRLSNYGVTEKGVGNLMQEFSVGKYTFAGLAAIMAQGTSEAYEKIYARIDMTDYSKSVLNAVVLDEKENYTRDTINVAGLADLIDRMMMNLSSVCGIPVTKLFGRSPAGMNATGEFDLKNYYDEVEVKRDNDLLPEVQRITNIIGSYVYPGKKQDFPVTLNGLWEPSQKEQAEIDNLEANTYEKWIVNMVLDPEEVRRKLFPELGDKIIEEELPFVKEEPVAKEEIEIEE